MQNRFQERQSQLISTAIAQSHTPIATLADEANVSERTVYNWQSGGNIVNTESIRNILKSHILDKTIKLAVLKLLLENTGMDVVCLESDTDVLDANGDGHVDCEDALMHAGNAAEQMTTGVRDLIVARSDGRVTDTEYDRVIEHMDNTIAKTHAAKRSLEMGYQAQPARHRLSLTGNHMQTRNPSKIQDGCTGGSSQAQG